MMHPERSLASALRMNLAFSGWPESIQRGDSRRKPGLLPTTDSCTLLAVIVSASSPRLRDRSTVFFKPKPNLPDAERARIDFHFQQIAECVGFDRFRLPVLPRETLLELWESEQTPPRMIRLVADHLDHDTAGLRLSVAEQPVANSSGGG
jgi:hypothetical protein